MGHAPVQPPKPRYRNRAVRSLRDTDILMEARIPTPSSPVISAHDAAVNNAAIARSIYPRHRLSWTHRNCLPRGVSLLHSHSPDVTLLSHLFIQVVPHRRSRSDAYPSQITIGVSSEACGYAPAAGLRVESIYRSRGSPSPEREHRRGRANRRRPPRESIPSAPGSEASDSDDSSVGQPIIRLERREGFGDDLNTYVCRTSVTKRTTNDSPRAPSSSSSETAYDTLQGEDVPTQDLHKSAPDEIDSLVLQWTNVGGDEMARASRV